MAQSKVKLVKAIEILADKIGKDTDANDALKFTQAALNAAHAVETLEAVNKE